MAKVISPSIIQTRINAQNENNLWNYVASINKGLRGNPIATDLSIMISFDWTLDQFMIDQIIEVYTLEGWDVALGTTLVGLRVRLVNNKVVGIQNRLPGNTTLIFKEATI